MTIFIGNLQWDTEEEDLKNLFNIYGEVRKCTIPLYRDSGRKRSFGFVAMNNNRSEKNGYKKLPQKFIPSKMINSLATFNREMKSMAAMVNRGYYDANIAETFSIFNWEPISLEKTLINMSNS